MNHHIIDEENDLNDAPSTVRLTEDRPAPAVELPRPKPISEAPRWGVRPVARRSARPLPREMFF
jgi:hypothetical protein